MTTKHDHLQDEIASILGNVSGLTIATSIVSGQEPARPYVVIKNVGWKKERESSGERHSAHVGAIVMLEVHIQHAGGEAGLAEERNRLDDLLENAFDTYAIADYADAHYWCNSYIHDYEGASGILDRRENYAVFVATVSVDYLQSPINS